MEHRFDAPVWRHTGAAAWRFVTLPHDVADDIEATAEAGGFGSVRVEVRIGSTTWATSIFPSKADASYVLPVKASVRAAEEIEDGDVVTVHLVVSSPQHVQAATTKRVAQS